MKKEPNIMDIAEANRLLAKLEPHLIKLPFDPGIKDFKKLILGKGCFVDKSLLIKELIESRDEVTLITRPRRWGKTLNMSMLRYFLQIEVDINGNEILENSNKKLFYDLKIANQMAKVAGDNCEDNILNAHQGKYPIIFIGMKDIEAITYDNVLANLRITMSSIFAKYEYIYQAINNKTTKTIDDKRIMQRFETVMIGKADSAELCSAINFLSEAIHKHHGKKPYILIDEYDSPLNKAYNTPYYDDILELIKKLFEQSLKYNENLGKSVVTGVFKIAKSGLFSGLNDFKEYSILHPKYASHFGFTENEVDDLLSKAKIKDNLVKASIKDWYNGYNIGGITIYNPWSLINFLTDSKIAPYWVNTESSVAGDKKLSTNLMITEQIHDQVNLLIANFGQDLTEIKINPEVVFSTIQQEANALFGLLLFGGYLSAETTSSDESGILICQARIPNREVLSIYNSSISLWIRDQLSIDKKSFDSLCKEFILEDTTSVKNTVDNALEIFGDRIAEKNESIFHGLIQSICLLKGDKHRLASESYTGQGRADSIFYPVKGKSDTVIIHEYKIIKDIKTVEELKASLEDAIWQIYDKIYSSDTLFKNMLYDLGLKHVEVRAIVVVCDKVFNKITTQIVAQKRSFKEMQTIVHAFSADSSDEDSKIIDQVADEVGIAVARLLERYEKREQKRTRKLVRK